ncbi:MAG: DUF1837 domain-containing protein [Alphaproteobacteria bacterium]|nr:DUF1837 domain-containing protein [Alphaproteobacteria bacterium]
MSEDQNSLASNALKGLVRSNANALETHLQSIVKDYAVNGTKTKLHGHFIFVDQNGHEHMERLIEAMRNRVTDYAIPRKTLKEAQLKDIETGTSENVTFLHEEAKKLFTDLEKSGEGGELLLFMLAENFLKLPQLLCKMSFKTESRDHFKGSDGVYADIDDNGNLMLYWGESKVYDDIQSSIRECLNSLAPFILEPESSISARENDLFLLSQNVNLDDPKILGSLKNYLNKHNPQNRKIKYCGIALACFDHSSYAADGRNLESVSKKISSEIEDWANRVSGRLTEEKLDQKDIHFFCIAIPSSNEFRSIFKRLMGLERV